MFGIKTRLKRMVSKAIGQEPAQAPDSDVDRMNGLPRATCDLGNLARLDSARLRDAWMTTGWDDDRPRLTGVGFPEMTGGATRATAVPCITWYKRYVPGTSATSRARARGRDTRGLLDNRHCTGRGSEPR
jgi:hypothetical protein